MQPATLLDTIVYNICHFLKKKNIVLVQYVLSSMLAFILNTVSVSNI